MTATLSRVLDVARSQLGTLEPGWNDNPGTQVTKYGRWYAEWARQPAYADTYWCAMFASWCLAVAGFAPADAGRYGNCGPWIHWFKAHGMWGSSPRPGAIVFYDWDGGGADHVGIVEAVLPDGRIQTLEGNATTSGQRDGVKRMKRTGRFVVGYGYPPYATPVPAAGGGVTVHPGGGSRRGYPSMGPGFGGPEDKTGNQRWWAAQWFRAMALHSPGYYAAIRSDPAGAREIARLEIGPATLTAVHKMANQVLGSKNWTWDGRITPTLWAVYPPVK